MLTIVCTNDIQLIIIVDTWKGCINRFNQNTLEINNGIKIMAASKKDAIKKYNHHKK